MLHKGLHLESNKTYLHETDYENFDVDTTTSKQDLTVSRLFKDKEVDPLLISGKEEQPIKQKIDCLMSFLKIQAVVDENELSMKNQQLWDLNYESSDASEDTDANDLEADEQEAAEAAAIAEKILKGDSLEEFK